MTRIRRILAATDLSGPARHAGERAMWIAAESGARLDTLHVVKQGAIDQLRRMLGGETPEVERRIAEESQAALASLVAELGAARGVSVEARVAVGVVVEEIVAQAEAGAADLLVLGSRGEGFLRHVLLGTTAERTLRRIARPMLVVRQVPHEPYRRVVVAVDFSDSSAEALRVARELAPAAELLLLHAFELPFEEKLQFAGVSAAVIERYRRDAEQLATGQLVAFARAAGIEPAAARLTVCHGDPSRVILEYEQAQDCDLLVVGKRGLSVVEELLLGSVTKHVLAEATADVLVVGTRSLGAAAQAAGR
jgi:nucleotide-binding universal stress UspA family protein